MTHHSRPENRPTRYPADARKAALILALVAAPALAQESAENDWLHVVENLQCAAVASLADDHDAVSAHLVAARDAYCGESACPSTVSIARLIEMGMPLDDYRMAPGLSVGPVEFALVAAFQEMVMAFAEQAPQLAATRSNRLANLQLMQIYGSETYAALGCAE